jgi:hypothetical protein
LKKYTPKEKDIQLQKKPTPLTKILALGQTISYEERMFEKTIVIKKQRNTVTGKVEHLSDRCAMIRDENGVAHTFTATDVFTNDIMIQGLVKPRNVLAEILGMKNEQRKPGDAR